MSLWRRLRNVIVLRILGVADTPHRIAWGVLWGFLVAMTPTIGLQIVLYLMIATVLRANKVSGIPILFISNPFTAAPLYYFCFWLGGEVLHGGAAEASREELMARISESASCMQHGLSDLFTLNFWHQVLDVFLALGADLWMGSLVLGLATGVPAYFLTLWGVRAYRRARGH
ncbi:MAG: DUF2062 domain-containing protein [Deltaproteobacteria bacterium]|nr:DUF2062 domain-containing protein [Deltaproteobacteria bacterium]